jgi:hypothetical protein
MAEEKILASRNFEDEMSNLSPVAVAELDGIVDKYVDEARQLNVARGIPTSHRHYVRRPNRKTRTLWHDILDIVNGVARFTVRQLFYQLANRGYEKSEDFYGKVDDAAKQMRLAGVLPFEKFADGSRQRRQVLQFDSLGEALRATHDLYREDLWRSQGRRVEVWCEKDALSGFFLPICQSYGVPFVAVRGFSSMSLISESATVAKKSNKPTVVCYFGDHDPSGRSMSNNMEDDFRWHGADITVERIALNPDQVAEHQLPTRPSKSTDSRTRKFSEEFGEGSVELDALPPGVLTEMIEDSIVDYLNIDVWEEAIARQDRNKATLGKIMRSIPEFTQSN